MASLSPLRGVQACVFDAYGTLFDFAAAARKVLGDDTRFITLWRDKQLQYTWLRAAQERHADFLQVTSDALDFALESIIGKSDLRDQLMSLFVTLDPFPEVPNVLKKLKTAGMRTAILQMGHRRCSTPRSRQPGWNRCWMRSFRSRRLASTNRTRRCTSWR
jgi:2-haloacid dehalogenase